MKQNSKISFFRQRGKTDCSIACLAMIFSYYKLEYGYTEIRRETAKLNNQGLSIFELISLSEKFHLNAFAFNLCPKELNNEYLPIITLLKKKHYVVIVSINKNIVEYLDPSIGLINTSREAFFNLLYYDDVAIEAPKGVFVSFKEKPNCCVLEQAPNSPS